MPGSKIIWLFVLLSFYTLQLGGQGVTEVVQNKVGQWYVYWGWNGSQYTTSDIHFEGSDHSFTLSNVIADDRQTEFTIKKYFHPEYFTTPQYNFRLGKYLKNNWDISIAIDHMKYVVRQDQTVQITGNITYDDTVYKGNYNDDAVDLTYDFLQYEHTDGLNYVNVGLRKNAHLSPTEKKIKLNFTYGFGLGLLVPKSDVTLLNKQSQDVIQLAGYGLDLNGGLRLTFNSRWFIQSELKTGYINLPNVRTTGDKATNAAQQFAFLQYNILFGANMFLKKTKSFK